MSTNTRPPIPGQGVRLPRLRARDPRTPSAYTSSGDIVPVSGLSMWDPVFLGMDEDGVTVCPTLVFRNMLVASEPGGGKSVALNNIVAHAALSSDVAIHLFDGKLVELSMWADIADTFVGPNPSDAIDQLQVLQREMDARYQQLTSQRRRKVSRSDGFDLQLVVVDEVAYYSATAGGKQSQEQFTVLLRDLVARGRAVGLIVVAATQRPSADIIPTSLRDIFGYRLAFRCTTDVSSDIILGFGWAKEGYSAKTIDPADRGVGFLLAEGGMPRRIKTAFLTDEDVELLVRRALWVRGDRHGGTW